MTSVHNRRAKVGKPISGHVIIATYADDTFLTRLNTLRSLKSACRLTRPLQCLKAMLGHINPAERAFSDDLCTLCGSEKTSDLFCRNMIGMIQNSQS